AQPVTSPGCPDGVVCRRAGQEMVQRLLFTGCQTPPILDSQRDGGANPHVTVVKNADLRTDIGLSRTLLPPSPGRSVARRTTNSLKEELLPTGAVRNRWRRTVVEPSTA